MMWFQRLVVTTAAIMALVTAAYPSQAVAEPTGFDDDAFVIEGEIQKPEVTVVISRENLNKAFVLKLEESFLQKIIESIRHAPF